MNNSLDLEIVNIIKNVSFFLTKANSHLVIKEFHKSLELYNEAYNTYVANKAYNESVNQHYEGVILSLKGFVCMALADYEQAESLFNASLKINPHDTLTLMRRSTLFSKVNSEVTEINRLSEAIEDAEKVYISNPECKNLKETINFLEEEIEKIDNENERMRLLENLSFLTGDDSKYENIEINEDEILSFSNLKSIEKTSTSNHLKTPKINKNSNVFSQNSVLEEEVESSDEIQEFNGRTPCTHLLKTQSICVSPKHPYLQKELQRSSEFAGFIEEKFQRRTSVKFSEDTENANQITNLNNTENPTPKFKKTESEKKKSCLRISKYSFNEVISQSENKRRSSSFHDIKNIDGTIISSLNSKMTEKVAEVQLKSNETNKSLSDTDSDDENNEYCIYGNRLREISITRYLENLTGCENHQEIKEQKKNSILKNSFVFSHRSSKESKGGQKKSVCFADENSKPFK